MVRQQKSSTKPTFDPMIYTVTEEKGTQMTARRKGKERKRNKVKMKVVTDRQAHLQLWSSAWMAHEDSDSDNDIQLGPTQQAHTGGRGASTGEAGARTGAEVAIESGDSEEKQQATEAGPRK